MLLKVTVCLLALIIGVFSQCNDKIHVNGVSDNVFSNNTVNGVYVKMTDKCDSNEVFRQSDNYAYLYHIGGDQGYWMFREEYSCTNNDTNNGLVRVQSDEANPGDIQAEWEEYTGSNWSPKSDIEVTCYEVPGCRYQLLGANNDSLNGYYDVLDNGTDECSSRDVYKHEDQEAYLYFVYSNSDNTYYWVVSDIKCVDAVTAAFLRNEDYTASPLQVVNAWEENINGTFQTNSNVALDCVDTGDSGLSAGAIAGITIGCVAVAGGTAGGLGYYFSKRK